MVGIGLEIAISLVHDRAQIGLGQQTDAYRQAGNGCIVNRHLVYRPVERHRQGVAHGVVTFLKSLLVLKVKGLHLGIHIVAKLSTEVKRNGDRGILALVLHLEIAAINGCQPYHCSLLEITGAVLPAIHAAIGCRRVREELARHRPIDKITSIATRDELHHVDERRLHITLLGIAHIKRATARVCSSR